MNNFKDSLKSHFEELELSNEQLENLQKLGHKKPKSKKVLGTILFAVAASALAYLFITGGAYDRNLALEKVAQEIAYNHAKGMRPEVLSKEYEEVSHFLGKLDFALIVPKRFSKDSWELIGGRYCSIAGKIAAQLRLRHRTTGQIYTLYEAQIPQTLKGQVLEADLEKQGSHVTLWKERGLLLGLAGPQSWAALEVR